LARIIGPVLAGMVMSGAGAAAAFMVSATVAAAGLMMALVLGVRRSQRQAI
jgi:hypothetical protein